MILENNSKSISSTSFPLLPTAWWTPYVGGFSSSFRLEQLALSLSYCMGALMSECESTTFCFKTLTSCLKSLLEQTFTLILTELCYLTFHSFLVMHVDPHCHYLPFSGRATRGSHVQYHVFNLLYFSFFMFLSFSLLCAF